MDRDPYAFWDALLVGEPADLARNEVVCGRFWKYVNGENVGIAIDPLGDGDGFEIRIAKRPPFTISTAVQIEDFCEKWISWICRQPVSHEDYDAWWRTGQWRDGALIDRKPPKPDRRKKPAAAPVEPKLDTPTEPVTQDAAATRVSAPGEPTAAPGIFVRTYSCIDPCPEAEAYYARAIIRRGTREGTSVGFYAESAEAAREKAHAWVQAERDREAGKAANIAAGVAKRQQPRPTDSVETGASL